MSMSAVPATLLGMRELYLLETGTDQQVDGACRVRPLGP